MTATKCSIRNLTLVGVAAAVLVIFLGGCRQGGGMASDVVPTEERAIEVEVFEVDDELTKGGSDDQSATELIVGRQGPRRGGVLSVPLAEGCGVPDPAIDDAAIALPWEVAIVREIHAGLTKISAGSPPEVVGELAERFDSREQGRVFEFTLRPDMRFSDGSPLTASDVKWSWERALRKSNGSSRANLTLGVIEGASEVAARDVEELDGVDIVDDRTLVVTLSRPRFDFPMLLADPVASVLKKENVEKWDADWTNRGSGVFGQRPFFLSGPPVGAGPFKLSSYGFWPNPGWGLLRNEHYWGKKPRLEGVKFVANLFDWSGGGTHEEGERRAYSQLMDGNIDFMESDGTRSPGPGMNTIFVTDNASPQYLAFNPGVSPFEDVNVRKSLVAAANVEDISAFVGGVESRLLPKDLVKDYSPPLLIEYDLERARSLLSESTYAERLDQFSITVLPFTWGSFWGLQNFSERWQRELGIDIDYPDLMASYDYWAAIESQSLGMVHVAGPLRLPNAYEAFNPLLSVFGFSDSAPEWQEVVAMLAKAQNEPDAAERLRRYAEVEQHLIKEALVLPIGISTPIQEYMVQPWVHGLSRPKYGGSMFHDVWLDETAPVRPLPE